MRIYGYTRISTNKELKKQEMQRQLFTLNEYCNKNKFEFYQIIQEDLSGKTIDRPKFKNLIENMMREEDILVVCDFDRIGRNADETIELMKQLKRKKIKTCILDMPYLNDWKFINREYSEDDSESLYNMTIDILITLKAHTAQQERLKISQRTKQALAAKKDAGVKLGRPESHKKNDFLRIYKRVQNKELTVTEASKLLQLSRNQFYNLKNKYIES